MKEEIYKRYKDVYVRNLFDRIYWRYDLMNKVMSLGMDQAWRKRVASLCGTRSGSVALDVCAGTGALLKELRYAVGEGKVIGVDFSINMLKVAKREYEREDLVSLVCGDALNLPFRDNSFDCVTAAYCLRNLKDVRAGVREVMRVLKPGGRMVVLDLSMPANRMRAELYRLYLGKLVPLLGWMIVGHWDAYAHMLKSLEKFPVREALVKIMEQEGFEDVKYEEVAMGAIAIHHGMKPKRP